VHDAAAWTGQVAMFLLLGEQVSPRSLLAAAPSGLTLALLLAFFARPVVAAVCLAPFRYPLHEIAYIGWLGLRGAVPIILGTLPVLAGVDPNRRLFHVIFFIVLVNALLPGATVGWITRHLRLHVDRPPPPASLEVASTRVLHREILAFYLEPASAACGVAVGELPLPEGAAAMLVVRGAELLPARDATVLEARDWIYVFCRPTDRGFVKLLFGRTEEG
jgi:cell volume regulation protein A